MFTKIGEYLKPILGWRDHVPLDAVRSIDPDEHHGGGKGTFKKRFEKHYFDEDKDTMFLSLDALIAMLEPEMIEDLDLYADVQYLMSELKKKNVTDIPVLEDEKLFHALEKAAYKYGIEKPQ